MIQDKDSLIQHFNNIVGDSTDDNVLTFLEDFNDTIDNYETLSNDNANWKKKYEENDTEWRKRYKDRFMNKEVEETSIMTEDIEDESKPKTFDDLFEKGK